MVKALQVLNKSVMSTMKTYTITYIDNQSNFQKKEVKADTQRQAIAIFIQNNPQYKRRIRGIS